MNLFRSEEHARQWIGYKPGSDEGIVALADMAGVFSGNFFQRRLDQDYLARMREYARELAGSFNALGSFWQLPPR